MTLLDANRAPAADESSSASEVSKRGILNEKSFKNMIAIERKRTERSHEPFLLMLLEAGNPEGPEVTAKVLEDIASALLFRSRDTDIVGWYSHGLTVGVIFTGLESGDQKLILSTILTRVKMILQDELNFNQFSQLKLSFHFFPDWEHPQDGNPS